MEEAVLSLSVVEKKVGTAAPACPSLQLYCAFLTVWTVKLFLQKFRPVQASQKKVVNFWLLEKPRCFSIYFTWGRMEKLMGRTAADTATPKFCSFNFSRKRNFKNALTTECVPCRSRRISRFANGR